MLSVQIEMDTQNVLLCWTYKNITQFIAVRSSLNGTYNLPVKRRLTISINKFGPKYNFMDVYSIQIMPVVSILIHISGTCRYALVYQVTCYLPAAAALPWQSVKHRKIYVQPMLQPLIITEGRSICRDKNHVQLEFLCLCKQLALCMHMCACLLFARTLD